MANFEKNKGVLKAEYDAKINEINKMIGKATSSQVEEELVKLQSIEKEYLTVTEKEVFASLPTVHEAIVKYEFETIGHKRKMEKGVMMGVEGNKRNVQIDLKKFCEEKKLDMGWWYELQALNKRFTLRLALAIGASKRDIEEIDSSYCMERLAKDIDLGKTPTSDTQCVKHMQRVLDLLSDGEGRVNGHDLAFIVSCYGKPDKKKALNVIASKHSLLQSNLQRVFHRVATGGVYGLSYKKDNATATTEAKTETAPKKEKAVKVKKEVAA